MQISMNIYAVVLVIIVVAAAINWKEICRAVRYIFHGELKQVRLCVKVPEGMLVAYSSDDPDYPGIHIELAKDGVSYMLNLSTVEYKMEEGEYVTHVWGDASKEDTTHDIRHENVSGYFQNEE